MLNIQSLFYLMEYLIFLFNPWGNFLFSLVFVHFNLYFSLYPVFFVLLLFLHLLYFCSASQSGLIVYVFFGYFTIPTFCIMIFAIRFLQQKELDIGGSK